MGLCLFVNAWFLPLVLIFTIKKKKPSQVSQQPPRELQFYEKEELDDDFYLKQLPFYYHEDE